MMNWKLIFAGGIVLYIAQFLVGMITGPILHQGILEQAYDATAQFWRPELNQEPPDMTALLPRWITTGLVVAFVSAGIYGLVRSAFSGPGWQKGLKFGLVLFLVNAAAMASWSGVFNLPDTIWMWWAGEMLLYWIVGGAVLGWFGERFAAETA